MNFKSYLSLGAASIAVLIGASAAEAASLAPGKLSLVLDTGIFFSGNIIDFSPVQGGDRSLGTPGAFDITTSAFDTESGIFADDPLLGPNNRTFLGADGRINDLAIPKAVADSLAGGGIQDGVTYNFASDFGLPPEFAFLDFDTDGDGQFGEGDDFQYFVTDLTRNISGSTTGGFNVVFDFEGFFRDNTGTYEDTPSVISLFNGTTGSSDPTSFENVSIADFSTGSGTELNPNRVGFTASFDGTITTEEGRGVPEPTTIMGLLSLVGLAGGFLKRKKA